jgi:hypothetical protein
LTWSLFILEWSWWIDIGWISSLQSPLKVD